MMLNPGAITRWVEIARTNDPSSMVYRRRVGMPEWMPMSVAQERPMERSHWTVID